MLRSVNTVVNETHTDLSVYTSEISILRVASRRLFRKNIGLDPPVPVSSSAVQLPLRGQPEARVLLPGTVMNRATAQRW